MQELYSSFVKFTYTLIDNNGQPEERSWLLNLNYIISIKSVSNNDLKITLTDGKEILIDVGPQYSSSKLIQDILDSSALGANYSVYNIDSNNNKV